MAEITNITVVAHGIDQLPVDDTGKGPACRACYPQCTVRKGWIFLYQF